jgi:hypothetical protein
MGMTDCSQKQQQADMQVKGFHKASTEEEGDCMGKWHLVK